MKEISVDLNRRLLRSIPFIHFVSLNGTVRKLNSTTTLYDAMAFMRLSERGILSVCFPIFVSEYRFIRKEKKRNFLSEM